MKKILLTGPESSGKTTLAKSLAQHFDSPWVAEYARDYLNALNRPYTQADLDHILTGQLAQEAACLQEHSAPFLFCDTGPEVLYIWSEVKYGSVSDLIQKHTLKQHYDLRIICYPDLAWEADPLREAPNLSEREILFDRYCSLFEGQNLSYYIAKGQGNDRSVQLIKDLKRIFSQVI